MCFYDKLIEEFGEVKAIISLNIYGNDVVIEVSTNEPIEINWSGDWKESKHTYFPCGCEFRSNSYLPCRHHFEHFTK